MKSEDIIKGKMELICEAVDDYRNGTLSDMAALGAIGVISQAKTVDKEAIEWAKKVFMGGCSGCDNDNSCTGC